MSRKSVQRMLVAIAEPNRNRCGFDVVDMASCVSIIILNKKYSKIKSDVVVLR